MSVHTRARLCILAILPLLVLYTPVRVSAQQDRQEQSSEAYGSKFFDQLRSIFGRFRDADLEHVFQEAKPIECSELVGRTGEWHQVAFFNENRKLGDWCKQSLEEVKGDLVVYTFKGTCSGDRGRIRVGTEFPIADSIEAYDRKEIGFDQVEVNVNDPVDAVFDSRTKALAFELPYLFLTRRESSGNIYSFIAPDRNAAYATEVTSRWACKTVSSNDLTYRFLICRTSTAPRQTDARNRNWQPAFGASAYFILSDGSEAATSVSLTFGNATGRTGNPPDAGLPRPSPERPYLTRPEAAEDPFSGFWRLNLAKSKLPPPLPKSQTVLVQAGESGIDLTEELVTDTGEHLTISVKARFDGRDYPVSGSPFADAVSYQRLDSRTIKGAGKKDGRVIMHETVVVAADGKTMTGTYSGTDATGRQVSGVAVFDRVGPR
jgi:hypothetical protein